MVDGATVVTAEVTATVETSIRLVKVAVVVVMVTVPVDVYAVRAVMSAGVVAAMATA